MFHTHNSYTYNFDAPNSFTHRAFTQILSNTSLSHTYKFWTYQSSTTSFVFPPFPVPLELLFLLEEVAPVGVIRSLNWPKHGVFLAIFDCSRNGSRNERCKNCTPSWSWRKGSCEAQGHRWHRYDTGMTPVAGSPKKMEKYIVYP